MNEQLDRRIAQEFLGLKQHYDESGQWYYMPGGYVEKFQPTICMRAAYVIMEKIANKANVEFRKENFNGEWQIDFDRIIYIASDTLPLAISTLAEAIMDSPDHFEFFK